MTCPNRPGSKAGRRGAAPALRHDGGPQGEAGASPGRPPPRSPVIPGRRPTRRPAHQTAVMSQDALPPGGGGVAPRTAVRSRSPAPPQAAVSSGNNLPPSPRPTHTRGLLSPPSPLTLHGHDPGPGPQSRLRAWSQTDRYLGAGHGWPGLGGPAAPVW